jgi:hypothetical protein
MLSHCPIPLKYICRTISGQLKVWFVILRQSYFSNVDNTRQNWLNCSKSLNEESTPDYRVCFGDLKVLFLCES